MRAATPAQFENPPDAVIRAILERPASVAIVGFSPRRAGDSLLVARFLRGLGFRVIPINPRLAPEQTRRELNERCYASLSELDEPPEIVDVFRRPEHAVELADEAVAAGARVLWFQLGVVNHEAARRASAAGLVVVMDRCPIVEYRRLFAIRHGERV